MSRDALLQMATALQNVTRFSNETIISTEAMLLTFTKIGKDIFPGATEAVLDMSQALGQDTKNSAIQLGKALNDPIRGVTALRRVGVQLSDEQERQIKRFMALNDVASAQKIILQELATEFGGSARAAGQTLTGALDILHNKFSDFMEAIGGTFVPIIEGVAQGLGALVDYLAPVAPAIGVAIAAVVAFQVAASPLIATIAAIALPIAAVVAAVAAIKLAFDTNFGGLRDTVQGAWNNIKGPIEEIKNAISNILNPAATKKVTLDKNIFGGGGMLKAADAPMDFGERITQAINDSLPKIQVAVGELVGKIGGFITENLPKVKTAFENLLGQIGDWMGGEGPGKLKAGLTDLMTKAGTWISTTGWPLFKSGVEGLWAQLVSFIHSDGVERFTNGLVTLMVKGASWLVTNGWNLIKGGFETLIDGFKNWVNSGGALKFVEGIGNLVAAGVGWLINKGPDALVKGLQRRTTIADLKGLLVAGRLATWILHPAVLEWYSHHLA
jgi:hypothetical protein